MPVYELEASMPVAELWEWMALDVLRAKERPKE